MTDEELKELENRHFAPSENKTLYHVCRDCAEPCVYTEEEWDDMKDFLESHNCCSCVGEVMSPLPKTDFKRLVLYKAEDKDFWKKTGFQQREKPEEGEDGELCILEAGMLNDSASFFDSILRNGGEIIGYGYSGI